MPIQNREDLLNAFAKIGEVISASKDKLLQAFDDYPGEPAQKENSDGLALIASVTKEIEACEELVREARSWVERAENNNETDLQTCQQKEKALKTVRTHFLTAFNDRVNNTLVGPVTAAVPLIEAPLIEEVTSDKTSTQKSSAAIRTAKQRELLAKLKTSLSEMQEEFPLVMDKKGPKADMGALINILSLDLDNYINQTNHDNPDENAQYEHFKSVINNHLNEDPRAKAVRKPNSLLYPIHYAVVALFRAFFRIFDVILSLGAKQTRNDTPGYDPVFKLPEASLSNRAIKLSKEFDDAISKLDELKEMKPTTAKESK